ncbi:MaoC family dehydratase [Streptomyces sp. NPDC059063]|uniref:MaoC family dehydratase n=1 Tax=Streptomyces sp. NPDC059063 TaxID=3346712 RepID=UPI00369C20A9
MSTLTLLKAAALSPLKRPRPDAPLPGTPLSTRTRVDVPHLVAYERICGFATERGPDEPLPLTYPHVLAFPAALRLMAARGFPLPLLGLVHTSLDIVQHRALRPSEELELTTYAEKLAPHRRGTEVTIATRVSVVGGETTWESRSTYLARHKAPATREPSTHPHDSGAAPLPTHAEWHLPEDLGRRYAAASGDRNPIHLHPLTARVFGFDRPIAHGMWTIARCVAEHGRGHAYADEPDEPLSLSAEFRAPVPLPGTVTYAAKGRAFELRGQKGRRHLWGTVCPGLPGR